MDECHDRSFYDDPDVHRRYTAHRSDRLHLSPNHVMEEPALLTEVGDFSGLDVLDLGCGDGAFGRMLPAAGARSYTGVDDSQLMVSAARESLAGTPGRVILSSIATYVPAPDSFDLITARLSLHYLDTIDVVVAAATRALRPGGRFLATVVHPVITSHDDRSEGPRTTWTVDDYFASGPRTRRWMGADVVWHHRTVEDYVMALLSAGLTVTAVRECAPDVGRFEGHHEEWVRRSRVPLFLLLCGRKSEPVGDQRER